MQVTGVETSKVKMITFKVAAWPFIVDTTQL